MRSQNIRPEITSHGQIGGQAMMSLRNVCPAYITQDPLGISAPTLSL